MKDKPCIRIGHLKIVDHLLLGIAGLQQNISPLTHSILETVAANSWNQVSDALIKGDITGAFIPAPIAMDLFSAGLDIRILMFAHRSGSLIMKNKNAGIQNFNAFKGKTILVPSELSIKNMLLHRLFSSAGLKFARHDDETADVVYEVVSPCLMAEMVVNDSDHDISGFAVAEPFGSDAVHKKIATPYCTTQSLWKNHPCCVFAMTAVVMEQFPKAVEELVSLFTQTAQHIEDSKNDEIFSMAQQFLNIDTNLARQVIFGTDICFNPRLLIPDIQALNLIQNYMADTMGVLKNKINVNHLVNSSFILKSVSETRH